MLTHIEYADTYLIIQFYGSITLTFDVTPDTNFGLQTLGQGYI